MLEGLTAEKPLQIAKEKESAAERQAQSKQRRSDKKRTAAAKKKADSQPRDIHDALQAPERRENACRKDTCHPRTAQTKTAADKGSPAAKPRDPTVMLEYEIVCQVCYNARFDKCAHNWSSRPRLRRPLRDWIDHTTDTAVPARWSCRS